jgi:hypothetical protein
MRMDQDLYFLIMMGLLGLAVSVQPEKLHVNILIAKLYYQTILKLLISSLWRIKMKCQRCNSTNLLSVQGKVSDGFLAWHPDDKKMNKLYEGYVPENINMQKGDSDNIEFDYCTDCGQIQGKWPCKSLDETLGIKRQEDKEYELRDEASLEFMKMICSKPYRKESVHIDKGKIDITFGNASGCGGTTTRNVVTIML